MTERKPSRFEIRLPADLEDRIDEWRRAQPDLPPRAEAARRLIEVGLNADKLSATSATRPKGQAGDADQVAESAIRKHRAKPLSMSKEAQIRALRERDAI